MSNGEDPMLMTINNRSRSFADTTTGLFASILQGLVYYLYSEMLDAFQILVDDICYTPFTTQYGLTTTLAWLLGPFYE